MPSNATRLNTEKLCLLIALIPASAAIYSFIASAPAPLLNSPPLTDQREPRQLTLQPVTTGPELSYFAGARKTPFRPVEIEKHRGKPGDDNEIFTPSDWRPGSGSRLHRRFSAVDPASIYDFVGVVVYDGKTHGLLRGKNGSKPRRVALGDVLTDGSCTVTGIDPQAIRLKDRDGNVFELKDWRTKQAQAFNTLETQRGKF